MPAAPEAPVGKDCLRRIMAGSPGYTAAGMGAGTAQVQPLERHAVIRAPDHGAGAEQLVEAHLAVENVATDKAEAALEVERRVDLPAKHRLCEPGGVRVDGRDDLVCRFIAFLVPAPALAEVVPEMLAEEAGDMLSLRRQGRVQRRGYEHLDDRLPGPAVHGRIKVGAVHVI